MQAELDDIEATVSESSANNRHMSPNAHLLDTQRTCMCARSNHPNRPHGTSSPLIPTHTRHQPTVHHSLTWLHWHYFAQAKTKQAQVKAKAKATKKIKFSTHWAHDVYRHIAGFCCRPCVASFDALQPRSHYRATET